MNEDEKVISFDLKARQKQERLLDALKEIATTKKGRFFLWTLLEEAKVFSSGFNSENTNMMSFIQGQKEQGFKLMKWLDLIDNELIWKISKENKGEK
ncbi:MAG: hypothetical protein PHE89_02690 [Alphaproteobacteria bacterium]|nr:hypothetical protein [Alphaproteobacteria bacterium]